MEANFQLGCKISTSDHSIPLGLEIWLNDNKIFDQNWIKETVDFSYDFDHPDGDCELRFVMKNKTTAHTVIDQAGNIVKDAMISITNIRLDHIDLEKIIPQVAVYSHDFNGTGELTQIKFHKEMGCNGTVSLKFTTPVHLWLLENM